MRVRGSLSQREINLRGPWQEVDVAIGTWSVVVE